MLENALAGRNAVPTALANSDGKLDTKLLLASILPTKNTSKIGNAGNTYMAALEAESTTDKKIRLPAVRKTAKARFVIVKKGDNLSKIALRSYGDPLAYGRIFNANRKILQNANVLEPGQKLLIPR